MYRCRRFTLKPSRTVSDSSYGATASKPMQINWSTVARTEIEKKEEKQRAAERKGEDNRKKEENQMDKEGHGDSMTPSRERNVSILLQLSAEINYARYAWMEFMHYSFGRVHSVAWSYRDTFIKANRSRADFSFMWRVFVCIGLWILDANYWNFSFPNRS